MNYLQMDIGAPIYQ